VVKMALSNNHIRSNIKSHERSRWGKITTFHGEFPMENPDGKSHENPNGKSHENPDGKR
jgi:hypothetical protein